MAAALITLIVESRDSPWELDERIWEEHLPERVPAGRSEWRNATYALQAAGSLAAGVWLDVGRQESFWQMPLWPFTIDLVEMLTNIARVQLAVDGRVLASRIAELVPSTAAAG